MSLAPESALDALALVVDAIRDSAKLQAWFRELSHAPENARRQAVVRLAHDMRSHGESDSLAAAFELLAHPALFDAVSSALREVGVRLFMNIPVRQEQATDVAAVAAVIRRAYAQVPFSNHREHLMVERLRASQAFIPELSLIAEVAGEIVGHLLLTRITVRDGETPAPSLSLAPLSVVPEFQRQGVGAALINEAHQRARQLGFRSVIVVGIAGYYQKFGYVPLERYPITVPFKVRAENCAIVALCDDGLTGLRGTIEYAPEWMES